MFVMTAVAAGSLMSKLGLLELLELLQSCVLWSLSYIRIVEKLCFEFILGAMINWLLVVILVSTEFDSEASFLKLFSQSDPTALYGRNVFAFSFRY